MMMMMICRNLGTNDLTPSEPCKNVRGFTVLSAWTVGMDNAVSEEAITFIVIISSRLHLKCDGTRAETIFRLSAKRASSFKSAGASVRSTTGSRGVRISGSNAGYTMFLGSVKSTGYPLHSPVSPSLPLPCVTVCHRISTGLYQVSRHTDTQFWKWTVAKCRCNITIGDFDICVAKDSPGSAVSVFILLLHCLLLPSFTWRLSSSCCKHHRPSFCMQPGVMWNQ